MTLHLAMRWSSDEAQREAVRCALRPKTSARPCFIHANIPAGAGVHIINLMLRLPYSVHWVRHHRSIIRSFGVAHYCMSMCVQYMYCTFAHIMREVIL